MTLTSSLPIRHAPLIRVHGGSWARICSYRVILAGSTDSLCRPLPPILPLGGGAFLVELCISGVAHPSRPKLRRGFDFGPQSRQPAGRFRALARFRRRRLAFFCLPPLFGSVCWMCFSAYGVASGSWRGGVARARLSGRCEKYTNICKREMEIQKGGNPRGGIL